jgi:hypothetical protein
MELKLSRLRRGEVIAAVSALALMVFMFALPWLRFKAAGGGHTDADGWDGLPLLRWFLLVTGIGGIMVAFLQSSRRAPALPVAADVVVTTLTALTTLLLVIRLPTSDGTPLAGAFLGLVAAAGVTAGAFQALRREDGWRPNAEHPIETLAVAPPQRSS